jgi:beta-lactam-binding protein with PASTA domain
VPRVVGMSVDRAQAKLERLHLKVKVTGGSSGRVVAQSLPAETAAAPGLEITLTVKA